MICFDFEEVLSFLMYNVNMFNKEFLKTLTIMYVEDDKSIRESLGSILEKVFKEVVICSDGRDGLERFKLYHDDLNTQIDAIVSEEILIYN